MYWLTFNSHKQEKAKSDNAITVCLCHPVYAVVVDLTIEWFQLRFIFAFALVFLQCVL